MHCRIVLYAVPIPGNFRFRDLLCFVIWHLSLRRKKTKKIFVISENRLVENTDTKLEILSTIKTEDCSIK